MRKIKLLLATALSLIAWTGTMAQTDAEYEAALAAIQDNGNYYVKSDVGGTYYYLTGNGTLTSTKAEAAMFTFQKTSGGGYKEYGYKLNNSGTYFSNPPGTSESNLASGKINTNTSGRATFESQVFFLKDGKYAVRACNTSAATSGWNWVGGSFWTVVGDVDPIAQYQWAANYCWELEGPITAVNVTYKLVEADGTEVSSTTKKQEANSAIANPLPGTFTDFNGFLHEKFYYDYAVSGTIGDTDCTITITRTEKAGVVKALTDLSNTKAYNIGCDRGAMIAYDGKMVNTALNNAEVNAQPYGKFALLNYEDNYYIFSIDENKFVKNDASVALDLTEVGFSTADAMVMTPQTAPYFLWHFNAEGKYLNTNGNLPLGYVINAYSTPDPGNLYYMVAVDDFDPTAALAELEAYFHPSYFVTYIVKDELGNTIFTSEPQPAKAGAHITSLPAEFQRNYYTYNVVDVTISEQNTNVEFTATWDGPFEISADFASAHWYDMAMRGTWYVTSAIKDGDGAYKTQNANTMGLVEDSYQWAFLGNGYDGFKIINKAEGDGKSFGWTDATATNAGIPTIMDDGEGHHGWNIVPSTNTTVPAGSFCLGVPGTTLYINQYGGAGGSVKFWNSANNLGDGGSAFTVFDVPSNFASFVVDEIAPAMEATGYFAFTDAAKATLGWDPAYKTDCPFETYKSLKEKLAAIDMTDLNNFVLPETGYYTLKNKNYGTYMGIDPSDANMYGNYATAVAAKQIVKLTKNDDNTYTIGLMGKYAPATVAQSAQVKANTEAGTYTVVIPAIGYAAFQADAEAQYSALHRDAAGKIVGWETAAAASQWEVIEAESIQLTIGETGYATAYLPFPATPAGVYTPKALGTWTFDDPTDLTAGTGTATLEMWGTGVTAADGPDADNGAVSAPKGGGFTLDTHLSEVSSAYTLLMDVSFPDVSGYNSLYQNDINNGKDGSIFINGGKIGLNYAGLGYNGSISANTWYRIAIVVDNGYCTIYVDGEKVSASTSQDINAWAMRDTKKFLLFVDDSGEEKVTNTSEVRFWDVALNAEEVALLGGVGHTPESETRTVKAYTGKFNSTWLDLIEVDGTIPAATPVVLKGDPTTYVFEVANDVDPIEGNVLKGTFEPIEATDKYVLAKPAGKEVGFYKATSGNIAAGKAYLVSNDASIKAFYFAGDDATGIESVNSQNTLNTLNTQNSTIYNLAGQRISKMQKGINIVNGKKILK